MTIRELIERVIHTYSQGSPSDDVRLTNRNIYSKLITNGAKLTKQRLDKGHVISDYQYTYLDCVEMQCDNVHECDCLPNLGKKYWKSVHPLPEILSSRKGLAIKYVSNIDGDDKYSITSFDDIKYIAKGSRYASKAKRCFIKNGHLFLLKEDQSKIVAIAAIFNNPVEVANMKLLCDISTLASCYPMDLSFNLIDSNQVEDLIRLTVNDIIHKTHNTIEDVSNNASDSSYQKVK